MLTILVDPHLTSPAPPARIERAHAEYGAEIADTPAAPAGSPGRGWASSGSALERDMHRATSPRAVAERVIDLVEQGKRTVDASFTISKRARRTNGTATRCSCRGPHPPNGHSSGTRAYSCAKPKNRRSGPDARVRLIIPPRANEAAAQQFLLRVCRQPDVPDRARPFDVRELDESPGCTRRAGEPRPTPSGPAARAPAPGAPAGFSKLIERERRCRGISYMMASE